MGAVLDGGDPGGIAAVRDGRAAVQDEGSQLLALALSRADVETGPGPQKWLDLCAGPGGKAALLATLAVPSGATCSPTRSASTGPSWSARRCAPPVRHRRRASR